jgi:hypothetical protein
MEIAAPVEISERAKQRCVSCNICGGAIEVFLQHNINQAALSAGTPLLEVAAPPQN